MAMRTYLIDRKRPLLSFWLFVVLSPWIILLGCSKIMKDTYYDARTDNGWTQQYVTGYRYPKIGGIRRYHYQNRLNDNQYIQVSPPEETKTLFFGPLLLPILPTFSSTSLSWGDEAISYIGISYWPIDNSSIYENIKPVILLADQINLRPMSVDCWNVTKDVKSCEYTYRVRINDMNSFKLIINDDVSNTVVSPPLYFSKKWRIRYIPMQ